MARMDAGAGISQNLICLFAFLGYTLFRKEIVKCLKMRFYRFAEKRLRNAAPLKRFLWDGRKPVKSRAVVVYD